MTEVKPLLTIEDLKKRPLSYSSLKNFARSPLHFMDYRNKPKDKEESMALKFGNLIDCLLLTADEFDSRYIILPTTKLLKDCAGTKKEARREYDTLNDAYDKAINNARKIAIEKEMFDKAIIMRDVILNNATARKLIEKVTSVQCEKRWTDKETGLPVLTRLDGEGEEIIFELKTTRNADPDEFFKDAAKFGYYLQAGIELEALAKKGKFPQFWYLVIETVAPFGLSVFQPTKEYIEYGKNEFRRLITSFKHCLDTNRFHEGYEFKSSRLDKTHELDLPGWLKYKANTNF